MREGSLVDKPCGECQQRHTDDAGEHHPAEEVEAVLLADGQRPILPIRLWLVGKVVETVESLHWAPSSDARNAMILPYSAICVGVYSFSSPIIVIRSAVHLAMGSTMQPIWIESERGVAREG